MKNTELPKEAKLIIQQLDLEKTYEGVYLKRIYSSSLLMEERPAATSSYAMVTASSPSLLHRLDCDELWHFYAGCTLDIFVVKANAFAVYKLGTDILAGQQPALFLPRGTVFGALSAREDDWTLCGCTCVPGFSIANCEFIKADHSCLVNFSEQDSLIRKLTAY